MSAEYENMQVEKWVNLEDVAEQSQFESGYSPYLDKRGKITCI